MTTLHFEIPRSLLLSTNQRMHWAPKARITKDLRTLGKFAALGKPSMAKAHLTVLIGYPDKRQRDDHNLIPTLKALIDGVVDAGVLRGDSSKYLIGPDLRSEVARRAGVTVFDFEFEEVL